MFTSADKALAAAIMAAVFFAAKYFPPVAAIVTPGVVDAIVAVIVPLVWAIPNKPKA